MTTKLSRFSIGQSIACKEFVDCFGKTQKRQDDLTVTDIRHVGVSSPYYRITAYRASDRYLIEAAERFFESTETTEKKTCKYHNDQHNYVRCECGHYFCTWYWRDCPACNGAGQDNRLNITLDARQNGGRS